MLRNWKLEATNDEAGDGLVKDEAVEDARVWVTLDERTNDEVATLSCCWRYSKHTLTPLLGLRLCSL